MSLLNMLLPLVVFGGAAFGISTFLVQKSIDFAHKRDLLDHPNERSSHVAPTPRVGGIGLVAGIVVPLAVLLPLFGSIQEWQGLSPVDPIQWVQFLGLIACTLVAFGLGLWDDIGKPPALAKLAGQFVVAGIAVAAGLVVRQLHLPFLDPITLPWIAGAGIAFAWMVLMMNAVNFMDGINGLAGRFGEIFGMALAIFCITTSWRLEVVILGAIVFGASAGFLAWNLPQAKTFLGDCGSQALGAVSGASVLLFANNDLRFDDSHFDSFIGAAMIASPLIFDVLFTGGRRALRGENLLKAHREHLYQRYLAARGEDHTAALSLVSGTMIATAICGYIYANPREYPVNPRGQLLAVVCCAAVLAIYWLRGAHGGEGDGGRWSEWTEWTAA